MYFCIILTYQKIAKFYRVASTKYHNLEFSLSLTMKLCKNVAKREELKVTKFHVTALAVTEKIKKRKLTNPLMPGGFQLQLCLSVCDLFVTTRHQRVKTE